MNQATQSFLGRYRLVKVLGQGAMGVVYEAVDTRLNRTVAIKTVLRSHLADESTASEYASRFEREAQAAARLAHPNVVTVYDFGEHEDISYIVMEFVRGRELNQAFEAGESFALPDTIRIMRELLAALDYAHEQGIVHRDIKPANVMLDHAGRVKLTDFGVARIVNANQDRTMPGTLVGTPSYMSPEQILGLAVGSRADIFAAGVILYQFLTGKRPFTGGGPFGVQRKIVQDDPDPPSVVNPQLPPAFDLVIARALAKQPEQRYETAAAFSLDLERIAATLPREGLHLDLDFSDPAPPASPAASPAPRAAAPAAGGLTLRTDLPAAPPPPAVAPPATVHDDPEATVVMRRAAPVPAAPPAPPAPAAASAAPPVRTAPARPQPAATASAAPAAPASAPAPARAPAPPPRPMPPTRQPGAATRRPWLPVAAGAGVAVLALGAWLLAGNPARTRAAAEAPVAASPPPAEPVLPATTSPAPTTTPAPAPTPAPSPAPSPAPAPAPATLAAPAAPPPETTAPPPARPAPAQARRATDDRNPPAPAPVRPAPAERSEPRAGALDARCSDLLQRMQLGEPLTPEQTQVFQTRCTR